MAHENSFVLKTLLKLLDDERNDIYIHFDAKCLLNFKDELKRLVTKSGLYFTDKRLAVIWGNISQVEAEYVLFEAAYNQFNYSYYHLLSGSDLPLKSQDFIHAFFEKMDGKEFIGFSGNIYIEKVRYIHIFSKYFRSKSNVFHLISNLFIFFQRIVNYNRVKNNPIIIKKGPNWVSVTNKFVSYIIDNKGVVLKLFKFSKSPEEFYKQTLAYNSTFNQNIFSKQDTFVGCLREIDWVRGFPYIWKSNDFDYLVNSEKIFARKFSEFENELVVKIQNYVLKL